MHRGHAGLALCAAGAGRGPFRGHAAILRLDASASLGGEAAGVDTAADRGASGVWKWFLIFASLALSGLLVALVWLWAKRGEWDGRAIALLRRLTTPVVLLLTM